MDGTAKVTLNDLETLDLYAQTWKEIRAGSEEICVTKSYTEAVGRVEAMKTSNTHVFVTGSLYLVGGILGVALQRALP